MSIDEGVVLDSPSGSISPGALTSSQTSLCSASGKSLTVIASGGEGPMTESDVASFRRKNDILKAKLEEREKERDQLEKKLKENELLIANLQERKLNEVEALNKSLLDAQNQAELYRQENAKLEEKIREMEHGFAAVKKSEKKLLATTHLFTSNFCTFCLRNAC